MKVIEKIYCYTIKIMRGAAAVCAAALYVSIAENVQNKNMIGEKVWKI